MELKQFFKKSRKFYLLVLLLLIFTVPVALSGCGGGGSGSGGGGSTPSGGGSGSNLSSFGVTGYGGTTQLTSGTVTAYEYNSGTSTQIGTCSFSSAGGCTVYFNWDGSTTGSYYAVITNVNGNPNFTLIGAAVPAGTYSPTLNTFITLGGDVDETTTVMAMQLLASMGGSFTSNNELSSYNSSIFGTIQSFDLTKYTADSNYLPTNSTLTSQEINTIYYVSDALALCIQSGNSSSSQCSALFTDAANGSGAAATNTAEAAYNLVQDIEYASGYNAALNLTSASANLNSLLSYENSNMTSSLPYEFTGTNQLTSSTSLNFGNFIVQKKKKKKVSDLFIPLLPTAFAGVREL